MEMKVNRKHKSFVDKAYNHWSFMVLCIYCFIGLLASMFYLMASFTKNPDPNSFTIGIILLITSMVAGIWCKIIDDSSSGYVIDDYIDSVPDDRKDQARRLFK